MLCLLVYLFIGFLAASFSFKYFQYKIGTEWKHVNNEVFEFIFIVLLWPAVIPAEFILATTNTNFKYSFMNKEGTNKVKKLSLFKRYVTWLQKNDTK